MFFLPPQSWRTSCRRCTRARWVPPPDSRCSPEKSIRLVFSVLFCGNSVFSDHVPVEAEHDVRGGVVLQGVVVSPEDEPNFWDIVVYKPFRLLRNHLSNSPYCDGRNCPSRCFTSITSKSR